MRENLKSGSVRGLIVTSEPILQQKVDYEPYSTKARFKTNVMMRKWCENDAKTFIRKDDEMVGSELLNK
jgi:hypothetical protein